MILIDTCVLLWLASERESLSTKAIEALEQNVGATYVSVISAFEIGVKVNKSKLTLNMPPEEWFDRAAREYRLKILKLDWKTAMRSSQLPPIHRDPSDRIIIATAMHKRLSIITPDPKIQRYPDLTIIW